MQRIVRGKLSNGLQVTFTLPGEKLINLTVGEFVYYTQFVEPQVLMEWIEEEQDSLKRISILGKL